MKEEIGFKKSKMEELSDRYSKERYQTSDIVRSIRRASSHSQNGLDHEYRSLIADFGKCEEFFSDMVRATNGIISDLEDVDFVTKKKYQSAYDKMRGIQSQILDELTGI